MRTNRVGVGALATLQRGDDGWVLAGFPKACYVAFPTGLVALVAPGVAPGPIHAELDGSPPPARRGVRAQVVGRHLEVGGRRIDFAGALAWRGPLPSPDDVRASADRIVVATELASRASLLVEPYRARGERARQRLMAGSLEDAARLLVGVGPGLTPSGDDALAGVVFALRATLGRGAEPRTRPAAEAGETGSISRGFLRWAARGQALGHVHDLLAAAACGDQEGTSRAARQIAAVGETSGADFLLGLRWGMEAASQRLPTFAAHSRR